MRKYGPEVMKKQEGWRSAALTAHIMNETARLLHLVAGLHSVVEFVTMIAQFFPQRLNELHLVAAFTVAHLYQAASPACQLNTFRKIITIKLIDLQSRRLFVANALQDNPAKRKLNVVKFFVRR
jgi:hypothetical protein